MPEISIIENLCCQKSGPHFTKNFQGMLLTKAPNKRKFHRNQLKNVGDICDQIFMLQKNWAKIHQNRFRLTTL